MKVEQLESIATKLTKTIRKNLEYFRKILTDGQSSQIKKIAESSGIDTDTAIIEYISNQLLFRVLRDYHDLPQSERFEMSSAEGFVAISRNGSIVSSPLSQIALL